MLSPLFSLSFKFIWISPFTLNIKKAESDIHPRLFI